MISRIYVWVRAVRANQWTKNALVFLGWAILLTQQT